ncbi:hypothetical protein TIFTF001_036105 [Ficus carica]|uniref:Uncharacterized protein n=1 Tax=Ficus carica TaxID=3494 RepID=A0AA88JAS1_FICCA|nr:hypothetical protein TIFTF001_036105 [Ficus carica]
MLHVELMKKVESSDNNDKDGLEVEGDGGCSLENDENIRDEYFDVNIEPPRVYDAAFAPGHEGDVLDVPTLEECPNQETTDICPNSKTTTFMRRRVVCEGKCLGSCPGTSNSSRCPVVRPNSAVREPQELPAKASVLGPARARPILVGVRS